MAMSLMNRAISRTETVGAFRLSFNLLRNFSTQPAAASTQNPSSDSNNKPKRKKKKNLIEVATLLPNSGIGYHMAKSHWKGISYEITKINLYKDNRHGKAWGIVHKDGLRAAEAPKKISGVHKRCWKYIPNQTKTEPMTTSATADIQAA